MLTPDDFNFGYEWEADGRVMYINHLWLDEDHRGNGSFILETLVRVAYYEGADIVEVSIGGGERAEAFLEKNGFHIVRRREYGDEVAAEEGYEYGVDGVRSL